MKIKTIVTGKNRKQLRSLALKLKAELEMTKLEKMATNKRVAYLRERNDKLTDDNKDLRENVNTATTLNKDMACKHYQLEKDKLKLEEQIEKLEQKDKLSRLTIETRDKQILNLRGIVDDLRKDNEQLKAENEKPLWKKVLHC